MYANIVIALNYRPGGKMLRWSNSSQNKLRQAMSLIRSATHVVVNALTYRHYFKHCFILLAVLLATPTLLVHLLRVE